MAHLEGFEVELLVARVLVEDEEVAVEAGNDEAEVELPDDLHPRKVGLLQDARQPPPGLVRLVRHGARGRAAALLLVGLVGLGAVEAGVHDVLGRLLVALVGRRAPPPFPPARAREDGGGVERHGRACGTPRRRGRGGGRRCAVVARQVQRRRGAPSLGRRRLGGGRGRWRGLGNGLVPVLVLK